MIKFNIDKKTMPKISINIGALLDIPTSSITIGQKGESIYNGGLAPITAIVGTGNNFKSTIMHYMMLSAADKIYASSNDTQLITYDTEANVSLDRLESLANNFPHVPKYPVTGHEQTWSITDKTILPGNEWGVEVNKYVEEKKKSKDSVVKYQCFKDPYKKEMLTSLIPTFAEIDSISEFEAKSSMEMLSKDLDSSDTNTFAMKQGLFKSKFLSTIPSLAVSSSTYFLFTAQLGEKLDMRTGPAMYQQPFKNLQYLKTGEHIKGVSPKFFFLIHNAWYTHTAKLLINDSTKLPEYPLSNDDNQKTDLNTVMLTSLRSKTGPSGFTITLVVSQTEGVLPSLSEFHFIKENKRYGLEGNLQNYHLDLYPEVNLSRTTIRSKLNSDAKLRRAVNITAEMLQLPMFHREIRESGVMCTPKELYEDIKNLGYNWDELLETRGYWTIDQYDNKIPYLSTVDLLKMRKGLYVPYWYKDKKG